MFKSGGLRQDQRGITIFEMTIVLLIIVLIAVSCIVTIRKIDSENTKHYDTYQGIESQIKK